MELFKGIYGFHLMNMHIIFFENIHFLGNKKEFIIYYYFQAYDINHSNHSINIRMKFKDVLMMKILAVC